MVKLLLWLILLVVSWPLALVALVLYPVLWLVTLPLRMVWALLAGFVKLLVGIGRVWLRMAEQSP